jgi:Domain of unknown function (DUF6285)
MSRGVPTSAELLGAVTELVKESAAGGAALSKYEARLITRALGIVERELTMGQELAQIHSARLRALGFDDDAGLALAIRSGAIHAHAPELIAALHARAVDRLRVDDPDYLEPPDR